MSDTPKRDRLLPGVVLTNTSDAEVDTGNLLSADWEVERLTKPVRAHLAGFAVTLGNALAEFVYPDDGPHAVTVLFETQHGHVKAIGIYEVADDEGGIRPFDDLDADAAENARHAAHIAAKAVGRTYTVDETALQDDLADVIAEHIGGDGEDDEDA